MEEITLFAVNHQFLKNVTLQKEKTNKPFVVLIKRCEICSGIKNIRGGSGSPAKANYLYSTLCSQDRVPETSCVLCNEMQIPVHLFTPVRWNMCSATCGGRAGGSSEARAKCSTVNVFPTSSEVASVMTLFKSWLYPGLLFQMNKVVNSSCADQLANSISTRCVNPKLLQIKTRKDS